MKGKDIKTTLTRIAVGLLAFKEDATLDEELRRIYYNEEPALRLELMRKLETMLKEFQKKIDENITLLYQESGEDLDTDELRETKIYPSSDILNVYGDDINEALTWASFDRLINRINRLLGQEYLEETEYKKYNTLAGSKTIAVDEGNHHTSSVLPDNSISSVEASPFTVILPNPPFMANEAVITSITESGLHDLHADGNVAEAPHLQATENAQNQFNDLPLKSVRTYFEQLVTKRNGDGQTFLSKQEVNQFIQRAFGGNHDLPKITMKFGSDDRGFITKLFYQFFTQSVDMGAESSKKGKKLKYVRLLSDNFTNFEEKRVSDSFNNSKKSTRKWDDITI